jgi:hypothetical protein
MQYLPVLIRRTVKLMLPMCQVRELRQWFNKEDNECLSQRADGTTADTTLNTAVMGAYFDICCQVSYASI